MESKKMATPEYVYDIRNGKYTLDGAIHKILNECNIKSLPVNPWFIAKTFNFEIFNADFKEQNISGMMIDAISVPSALKAYKCKRAIILNRKESVKTKAFTIAHELAHFIFDCNEKGNCFDAYHITKEKQDTLSDEELEKKNIEDQRDKFAASLLMPENLFVEYINNSLNRFDRGKLKKEMSEVCCVEEEAVERRFEEIGINF